MTTNFFTSIQDLNVNGDWKITLTKDKENNWIVSVLFFNEKVGDEARKLVPPMILKGTPHELDKGFFDSIVVPVEKAAGLFTSMEHYMKQLEEARLQSKMEKDKEDKEKKGKEERKKKYEAAMKKVTELETEKKFGEAIGAMPKTEDFPEQAEEIKKKMSELREKHGQLSLL
jgi:PRTRC genetic system protein E